VALKDLGVRNVICKAINDRQRTILLKVGADRVLLPEIDAGERLARELITPHIRTQLQLERGYSIVEIETPASLVGKTLSEANLRSQFGIVVLVIRSGDQQLVAPPGDTQMQPDDLLIVLGSDEDLERFVSLP
jgi:trk system potassium uptake protein TrkA